MIVVLVFSTNISKWICSGAEFNIQVCNALLRVKLENGEAFTPAEALSDIEGRRQLIPNRVGFSTVTAM